MIRFRVWGESDIYLVFTVIDLTLYGGKGEDEICVGSIEEPNDRVGYVYESKSSGYCVEDLRMIADKVECLRNQKENR